MRVFPSRRGYVNERSSFLLSPGMPLIIARDCVGVASGVGFPLLLVRGRLFGAALLLGIGFWRNLHVVMERVGGCSGMELISRDCWMRKGRVGNSDPGRTRQQGPLAGSREGGWNGSKCVSSICRDFARKRGRNAKEGKQRQPARSHWKDVRPCGRSSPLPRTRNWLWSVSTCNHSCRRQGLSDERQARGCLAIWRRARG